MKPNAYAALPVEVVRLEALRGRRKQLRPDAQQPGLAEERHVGAHICGHSSILRLESSVTIGLEFFIRMPAWLQSAMVVLASAAAAAAVSGA